jgi:hypothetical protein
MTWIWSLLRQNELQADTARVCRGTRSAWALRARRARGAKRREGVDVLAIRCGDLRTVKRRVSQRPEGRRIESLSAFIHEGAHGGGALAQVGWVRARKRGDAEVKEPAVRLVAGPGGRCGSRPRPPVGRRGLLLRRCAPVAPRCCRSSSTGPGGTNAPHSWDQQSGRSVGLHVGPQVCVQFEPEAWPPFWPHCSLHFCGEHAAAGGSSGPYSTSAGCEAVALAAGRAAAESTELCNPEYATTRYAPRSAPLAMAHTMRVRFVLSG